jgi:hypothetical protein
LSLAVSGQTLFAFQDTATELFGYQTKSNEVKISPRFFAIEQKSFKHFAFVVADSGWIGINPNGEFLFKAYIVDNGPDEFSNGLCRVLVNGKIGYVNQKGKIIIVPKYDCAERFKNGKAKVSIDCKKVMQNEYQIWDYRSHSIINKKGIVLTQ